MKKATVLGTMREAFNSTKSTRLREKHEDAMQHLHRLEADLIFMQKMQEFYARKAKAIDHDKNWNDFANMRQRQADFEAEVAVLEKRIEVQNACVEARCAALAAHNVLC